MEEISKVFLLISLFILALGLYFFYNWYYRSVPQSGIYTLPQVPGPKSTDTILIFSPHPDDETIAAGGYVKAATSTGATVWIVLVTDGNKHHLEKIRYNEFENATGALGVSFDHLIYLDYPDGALKNENQADVQEAFKKIVLQINPDIIFVPHPKDTHPDHATTGIDAEKVITALKSKPQVYYFLVHFPHFPTQKGLKEKLYVTPPLKLLEFSKEWVSFSLTQKMEDAKQSALLTYKSQLMFPPLRALIEAFPRRNELFEIKK
jgi:LmbE family N-acetylglucosaminyl deacetylase